MKKPHSIFFSKKQDIRPFEATNELEGICKKRDASLFSYISHNKKRPNNLIIGECRS
jgi:ribosome production factor 2